MSYDKAIPTLISNNVDVRHEIARWVLDRNSIVYIDERQEPGDSDPVPTFIATDAVIRGAGEILEYVEKRCAPGKRLYPDDEAGRDEVRRIASDLAEELARPVNNAFHSALLSDKGAVRTLVFQGMPWRKRVGPRLVWRRLAWRRLVWRLTEELDLQPDRVDADLARIRAAFARVDDLLQDGRQYLCGDRFTAADLTFAALAAPLVLATGFGVALPSADAIPAALTETIEELRGTKAGQHVLRLYEHERPPVRSHDEAPDEPGLFARLHDWLNKSYLGWKTRIAIFTLAPRLTPAFRLGKRVFVNRHALVGEVLTRDEDFTIAEINAERMKNLHTTFFLGMDRSERYDREAGLMAQVVERRDHARIREFVREKACELIALNGCDGRLDTVTSLTRVVPTMLLDDYFGIPAPDMATMMRWMRTMFWDLFLNIDDDEDVLGAATRSADELKAYLTQLIATRKRMLDDDDPAFADNVLNRMIRLQKQGEHEWLDDDAIRRNISGVIIGAVDTTSKCVSLVLDELFRRPQELARATAAAREDDIATVARYTDEALRFNPHNPVILRHAAAEREIGSTEDGGETYTIRAGHMVMIGLSPAMFDAAAFPSPKKFDIDRDCEYWHFGVGMHVCYGLREGINAITIPELTAAILRLGDLRRSSGRAGKIIDDGPFPNNFLVEFDASTVAGTPDD